MSSEPVRMGAFMVTVNAELLKAGDRAIAEVPEREIDSSVLAALYSRDVHFAGGIAVLRARELELPDGDRFRVELGAPDLMQAINGCTLLEEIRAACRRGDRDRVRLLAAWFRPLVVRVPDVHQLLDELPRRQAKVIAGLARGQGRPAEPLRLLAIVHTVERLVQEHRVTAAVAARMLDRAGVYAAHARIQNLHAAHAAHARMRARGVFVPASELAPTEWGTAPTIKVRVYGFV
jgi:hypothetical protein